YSYNVADELVTEDGVTYTYDLAGRLTSQTDATGTTTYQYDVDNHLVQVATSAGMTAYVYDVDGNRGEQSNALGTIPYLVDTNRALSQVLAEYTPTAGLIASYVYAGDVISLTRGNQTYAYHADAIGSTRVLTDSASVVTDTYDYDAFGMPLSHIGTTENSVL